MNRNYCVCCGLEVPEGRQVCSDCEYDYELDALYERRNKKKNNKSKYKDEESDYNSK